MSKFGVGVGDDFPVDDGGRGNQEGINQGPSDREEFEEWKRRRDEDRARREEWRRQREEWRRQREEWHARKRAFKEKVRQAARDSFGPRAGEYDDGYYGDRYGWRRRSHFPFFVWPAIGLLIPILILALIVSLIAAIFKSPFAFLALIALGVGFFMWRHGHRHYRFDGPCRGYDFDLKPTNGGRRDQTASPAQPPAQNGGAIITPPPASDEGKSTT